MELYFMIAGCIFVRDYAGVDTLFSSEMQIVVGVNIVAIYLWYAEIFYDDNIIKYYHHNIFFRSPLIY